MVDQSVPADLCQPLRESALAAAGVRGTFTNLIDGKRSVLATLWMFLIPPPASCSPCPTLSATNVRSVRGRPPGLFPWSKLTWEVPTMILKKPSA